MNQERKQLNESALEFVKKNKQTFISHVVDSSEPSDQPVAVFMAGTPGAGKTEIARNIMSLFEPVPSRIDADDFRELIPGYTGANSHIVQSAASLAVDKVLDYVLDKHYSFILDGTFAIGKSVMNIKRALRRGFEVQIYFVYQDPLESWRFTKEREKKEGRMVPLGTFVNAYYASRQNVMAVKNEFGDQVTLRVVVKSYEKQTLRVMGDVSDLEKVLPKLYNEEELSGILERG